MANNLQEGLDQFRDIVYNSDPKLFENFPGFTFNRDEYIFKLNDKATKFISYSKTKFSIKVGEEDLININHNGTSWDITKYDNTIYDSGDNVLIWLKSIIDNFINISNNYLNINYKENEYSTLLNKISNKLL